MAQANRIAGLDSLKKELRKVVLAGVGAAVLAKEGATDVAKRWLARGEKVEPELRKALKRITERRKAVVKQVGKAAATVDGRLKRIVRYLPLVTKNDLSYLAKRIDALAAKVEALSPKKRGR